MTELAAAVAAVPFAASWPELFAEVAASVRLINEACAGGFALAVVGCLVLTFVRCASASPFELACSIRL